MATEIFKVLGSIAIDTTDFNNKINVALQNVNSLTSALNNLNGSNVRVNVNTNGATTGGTAPTGGGGSSTSNEDNGNGGGLNVDPTIPVSMGGDGWTVKKGILSNLGTQVATWGFNQVKEFAEAGWERNIDEEKTEAMFQTLLNISETEAAALMDQLNAYARDTPLETADTWATAVRLLNNGIPAEDLIDKMWMLGDIAMGDSTKIGSLGKAYTETVAKGDLYAQEGYQFVNAGVPIWRLLETYYASEEYRGSNKGLNAGDIKGGLNDTYFVSAEDVDAAFRMATSEGGQYYNAMRNMMESTYGQAQRLAENMELIGSNITRPFFDFMRDVGYDKLLDVTDLAADLTSGKKTVEESFDDFETYQSFLHDYHGLGDTPEAQRRRDAEREAEIERINQIWLENQEDLSQEDYEDEGESVGGGGSGQFMRIEDSNDLHTLGLIGSLSTVMQPMFSQMKTEVTAAVREGMSGATITANVSTAPVRLDTGALVGELAPHIDLQLGFLGAQSSWG